MGDRGRHSSPGPIDLGVFRSVKTDLAGGLNLLVADANRCALVQSDDQMTLGESARPGSAIARMDRTASTTALMRRINSDVGVYFTREGLARNALVTFDRVRIAGSGAQRTACLPSEPRPYAMQTSPLTSRVSPAHTSFLGIIIGRPIRHYPKLAARAMGMGPIFFPQTEDLSSCGLSLFGFVSGWRLAGRGGLGLSDRVCRLDVRMDTIRNHILDAPWQGSLASDGPCRDVDT